MLPLLISPYDKFFINCLLVQILEMILFYGNYMNAGGRNAMSLGFEMKDLLKLANTKTGEGK